MSDHSARTSGTRTAGSLMQDVPGAYPARSTTSLARPGTGSDDDGTAGGSNQTSLSDALHARRAEYIRPKQIRIKVGSWNVAAFKGTVRDVGDWFVGGKGVTETLGGLSLHGNDGEEGAQDEREDIAAQEARYKRKKATAPKNDAGSLPGGEEVGLYVLGLQEVVDVNSVTEALRPYTDSSVANKWKEEVQASLPDGYSLVAEQQLIGMFLLIYASPDVAKDVKNVSTTSVGTGVAGYMGNKGAVAARIVLGETTRVVFVNSHLSAGADKTSLERRNWDAAQIVSRTKFDPVQDTVNLNPMSGEQIGDEDFAFWCGDLNYRLQGIPGDDVRRLLMLHTRNEYDLGQASSRKIENELRASTEAVKRRVEARRSASSGSPHSVSASSPAPSRTSAESTRSNTTTNSPPETTIMDEVAASDDPSSLQTTLSSLLPHDELQEQMSRRKAFYDGWREGDITFLPTYKYDAGSVGVFDSSEKKRAPSWCDRILYRSRRNRLAYEERVRDEERARKKDEEMRANGMASAGDEEEILYDYDPDADGTAADSGGDDTGGDYAEYDEQHDGNGQDDTSLDPAMTEEDYQDALRLDYYTAHQRILSSDHKPLTAVFTFTYPAVVPTLKSQVHAAVVRELDQAENASRPSITVVIDPHNHQNDSSNSDDSHSDDSASSPDNHPSDNAVNLGPVRWGESKHRSLTLANTGPIPASWRLLPQPDHPTLLAPKWLDLTLTPLTHPLTPATPGSQLAPGESVTITLTLRILDLTMAQELNEHKIALDDVLILRVDGGRDHFIPVRGRWRATGLGRGFAKLGRGWEAVRGRPTAGEGEQESSVGARAAFATIPSPQPQTPEDELRRLTEAVEGLIVRCVAEWGMLHPSGASPTSDEEISPWQQNAFWPFRARTESSWPTAYSPDNEDEALHLQHLAHALRSLDTSQPALLPGLPPLQALEALSTLLSLFLRAIPEKLVPAAMSSEISGLLETWEREAKARKKGRRGFLGRVVVEQQADKIGVMEKRQSILEVLGREPARAEGFEGLVVLGRRSVAEVGAVMDGGPQAREQRVNALAGVLGGLIFAWSDAGRSKEVLGLFLAGDGEGNS
ncbi:hypothetical protein B0A50_07669 [Salinomyces thailandicus]|uniref:Inositol polyphosphate-related phosphatase domain-containing protein n=1 Tax=Salinomyces thailandicus TaxID=706561 RepID=A0A4U0TL76_9PEZI|nr:hypothetical protein B0A50_07669 [Salinomyces thailandica]